MVLATTAGSLLILIAFVLPPVLLYRITPSLCKCGSTFSALHSVEDFLLVLKPPNTTEIVALNRSSNHCSGVSPFSEWILYGFTGINMVVNTSTCQFNATPYYHTSISGTNFQDDLTGWGAIYGPSRNQFTFYVRSIAGLLGPAMLNRSQIYQWNVNWVGIF